MKRLASALALALALSAATAGSAFAQTNLRIGLAEDPDVLDPSLARTYVGRIVFSSICDKLFDIDEKLNVVPQLALSHEESADGKEVTIKLRPNVKFHDGEPFDAKAAKYSLDRHRTLKGSFRKPELGSVDSVEVVDPLTIKLHLKQPFSPLLAQLTDRAGMMVSPKAAEAEGDKFGLHPVCAGPYKFVERVQQDRIVVEKFKDYWNKDNVFIDKITYLPIVDGTVRLANLRSGGLDLKSACWRPTSRRCAAIPSSSSARQCRWATWASPSTSRTGRSPTIRSPRIRACAARSSCRSTATPSTRSSSMASSCRATSGSTRRTRTIRRSFRSPSATSPRRRRS